MNKSLESQYKDLKIMTDGNGILEEKKRVGQYYQSGVAEET